MVKCFLYKHTKSFIYLALSNYFLSSFFFFLLFHVVSYYAASGGVGLLLKITEIIILRIILKYLY